eukprot:7295013-Prymnesium_polylepis.3
MPAADGRHTRERNTNSTEATPKKWKESALIEQELDRAQVRYRLHAFSTRARAYWWRHKSWNNRDLSEDTAILLPRGAVHAKVDGLCHILEHDD